MHQKKGTYIYVSGLDESFEKGMELLEHVLANVKPRRKRHLTTI